MALEMLNVSIVTVVFWFLNCTHRAMCHHHNHVVRNVEVPISRVQFCESSRWSCYCSIVSSFDTNFADTYHKATSLFKMEYSKSVITLVFRTNLFTSHHLHLYTQADLTTSHTWDMVNFTAPNLSTQTL